MPSSRADWDRVCIEESGKIRAEKKLSAENTACLLKQRSRGQQD